MTERPGCVKIPKFIKGMVKHTFNLTQRENYIVLLPNKSCYPAGERPIKQKKVNGIKKSIEKPYTEFHNEIISTWPNSKTSKTVLIEEDPNIDLLKLSL